MCDLQSFCSDHIIYVYFRGGYVNFSSDHSPDPTSNISDDWDDFLVEEEIFDDVIDEATQVLMSSLEDLHEAAYDPRSAPRKYIRRPREQYHQHLVDDYFSDNPLYPPNVFRRRFRMSRPLFLRIVDELGKWSDYFITKLDALNRQGLTPLQKCTAAIRQLANGSAADHLDEYLKIGDSTGLEAMKMFAEGVIAVFGGHYLRRPTVEDAERLLKIGESQGFPGMFGSIDCMHWQWERCPNAWKGQFTRGDQKVPTIILEAVASHDLWIWHAFFGVAGSNNDINVLNQSTLFIEELKGQAPQVHYAVNGNQYSTGYYLADGIYPEWAVFVKSISLPITEKDKLFAQEQESKRKDIERAFGVLRRRFCILKRPARLHDRGQLEKVVLACLILHNMIVEDEKTNDNIEEDLDLNEAPSTMTVHAPAFSPEDYVTFERVLEKDADIRDSSTHKQLKKDLIEHIWRRSRARRNTS